MKVLNDLSVKDLKLNKKRSIVIIIGIILSTALICGVAGIVTSFQQTFVETAKNSKGNYHAMFYNVPKDELKYIEENRDVESFYLSEELGCTYILNKNEEEEKPYVKLIAMDNNFLENMAINIKEGRLPENDSELIISTRINEKFNTNYKVGDYIDLNLNSTSKKYEIVGIINRPTTSIEPYEAEWFTVATKMNNVKEKANIAVLYKNPVDYKKNTEDTEYDVALNIELLSYEGASLKDVTLRTIYELGFFIMAIVLVSSVFVIRNGFAISITERLKQYGMLSSVGATKKQIKKSVYFEGFVLGLIGIPLGILSGIFAIYILVQVVNFILKDFVTAESLLVYNMSWEAVIISIIVSTITIWLSCRKSARRASKITPIDAIRSSEDIKLKNKKIKCPKIISKIFKTGGEIAYKNLKRSKKKYRTTVISIIVSVVIFIAISSFIQYGFKMSEAYYTEMNYNYYVGTSINTSYEDKEEYKKEQEKNYKTLTDISKLPDIGDFSINKYSAFYIPMNEEHKAKLTEYGEKIKSKYIEIENEKGKFDVINIVSLSKEEYEKYLKDIGGKYDDYKEGAILIDNNINLDDEGKRIQGNMYKWKKGDIITGKIGEKEYNIKIVDKTEKRPIGIENLYSVNSYFIVSDEFMDKVGTYNSAMLYAQAKDTNKLDQEIRQYKKENNILDADLLTVNIDESVRAENAIILVISIFLYGFIGVITLIGITNIFNTITTNMNLRKKEFAMLKSIGMTKKEFNRMIRLESVFYGMKSLIIGLPIGILLSYGIYSLFRNNMEMVYILPVKSIIIAILFVAIVIGIIMKYSMSKINKQNIIETIRNDNI